MQAKAEICEFTAKPLRFPGRFGVTGCGILALKELCVMSLPVPAIYEYIKEIIL
ncbi:hypothetical protein [Agrobacterium rosae]|uniref:Uncharacterized protein n=1 Tax=Agrobacterium rosae TaxID=1972867 RepID=A0AAW9FDJ9_9HYPH|nr:hypothetical protein [Agrobacterium rosae]MDX8301211.1 hypothetical protein [Agrobacterium rosae]